MNSFRIRDCLGSLIVLCLGILAIPAAGQETSLTIDFSSTALLDDMNTTADWDTVEGRLHLPYFTAHEIGSVPVSNVSRVAVQGKYAYVGRGTLGLGVIDVTDPTSPSLVYEEPAAGHNVVDVVAFGHIVMASGPNQGLHFYDITNPASPVFVGTASGYNDPHGLAAVGSLLYLADGANGLRILTLLGGAIAQIGYLDTPQAALDVDAHGGIAVVADNTSLRIIDVSDPTAPVEVSSYPTLYATSVQLVGTRAYVAAGLDLLILDISDPTNPMPVGSYPTSNMVSASVDGDYAVIGTLQGLELVDLRDPSLPMLQFSQGSGDEGGEAIEIAGRTFWADGDTFRILETALPVEFNSYYAYGHYYDPGIGPVFGMALEGNVLYALRGNGGTELISAYDATDAMNPTLLGEAGVTFGLPTLGLGVAAYGGFVYVAHAGDGLLRFDFRDPAAPQYLGASHTSDSIFNLDLHGDLLAVAGADSLYVLSLRDPENPVQVYSIQYVDDVVMNGIFAYYTVANSLKILNLASGSPLSTLTFPNTISNRGIATDGNYVYLFDNTTGDVLVVDVTDPLSPVQLPISGDTYYPSAYELVGDRLFVLENDRVFILDVSDPYNISELGLVYQSTPPEYFGGTCFQRIGDCLHVGREDKHFVLPILGHRVDYTQNWAFTLGLGAYNQGALASRALATKTDSVRVSLSGGPSDGEWSDSDGAAGGTATFRLYPVSSLVDPSVDEVTFEWAYRDPTITAITDTPNDQGKQVRIEWIKSANDFNGYIPGDLVTEYSVYRRIEGGYAPGPGPGTLGTSSAPPGDWDFLESVPADGVPTDGHYSVVVPTLADSTLSAGMHWTTFYIRARTNAVGSTYDSAPDSGYSVDNLAPSVPAGLWGTAGIGGSVVLSWEPNPEEDVQYYNVYRGTTEDFVPDGSSRIGSAPTPGFTDSSPGGETVYKVTAVDFSGNESPPALTSGVTGSPLPAVTSRFQLYPAQPNPFRAGSRIAYEVPAGGADLSLLVFDVQGRVVRNLFTGWRDGGVAELRWDGRDDRGLAVPAGMYFLRLSASGFDAKARLVRIP